jgi:hypothetical protein
MFWHLPSLSACSTSPNPRSRRTTLTTTSRRFSSYLQIYIHLSWPSCMVILPLLRSLVLFSLCGRGSISFASWRFRISLLIKITSCIIALVVLVLDFKASIIDSGELLWCLLIRPWRHSDCDPASRTVFVVLEVQDWACWATSSTGVGVLSCTSSSEITNSGSKGARLTPLKPPLIFSSVIVI